MIDELGTYLRGGVHAPLAGILGDCRGVTSVRIDRYSTDDGEALDSQVLRHMALYTGDEDVEEYLRVCRAGGFAKPGGSADSRIAWISTADVHHLAPRSKVAWPIAVIRIGSKLFVRVNLSAVTRAIQRDDGSTENVYTWFLLALLSHIPDVADMRWGPDVTRMARDNVNWARLVERHGELGVLMWFAGQPHDPRDEGGRTVLDMLGVVSSKDDPKRRRRLQESKVTRYKRGEFCAAAEFLPYGWDLQQSHRGVVAKGSLPVADPAMGPVLNEIHQMHGDGSSHHAIAQRLAQLERHGRITRRSGLHKQLTFADAAGSGDDSKMAAVVIRIVRPIITKGLPAPTPPGEETLAAYLGGGDPVDLFTLPQRLVIARIEALRTGVWLRTLKNDIRERGLVLSGVPVTSLGPDDEWGHFVIDAPWPWPVDPNTGRVIERFGIADDVLRRSAARILRGLDPDRAGPRGGRSHVRAQRRVVSAFGNWTVGPYSYMAAAAQGARVDLVNTVIFRRDASITGSWSPQLKDRSHHAVATVRQKALAASLAAAIQQAVIDVIDPSRVVPVSAFHVSTRRSEAAFAKLTALRTRAEEAESRADDAAARARGARQTVARLVDQAEPESALAYEQDAAEASDEERQCREQFRALRAEMAAMANDHPSMYEADVSITAYLVAALKRASATGKIHAVAGEIVDKLLTNWELIPDDVPGPNGGRWVNYAVDVAVPLSDAVGRVSIRVRGRVPNVRVHRAAPEGIQRRSSLYSGPRRDFAGALFFGKGMAAEDVALQVSAPVAGLVHLDLRAWAREAGVQSPGLVTALIDHPLAVVRQVVGAHAGSKEAETAVADYPVEWRRHIVATYMQEGRRWGTRAVPDDLVPIHRILATLGSSRSATPCDLATGLGIPRKKVRGLVTNGPRKLAGFARPRYLQWASRAKTAVCAIPCPHHGCGGTADRAVLLPEVAASGFGVICSRCRRVPNPAAVWARVQFPAEYLANRWSAASGPVPVVGRTITVADVAPLDAHVVALHPSDGAGVVRASKTSPNGYITVAEASRLLGVPSSRVRRLLTDPRGVGHRPLDVVRVPSPGGDKVLVRAEDVAAVDAGWIDAYSTITRQSSEQIYETFRDRVALDSATFKRRLYEATDRGELDAGPASLSSTVRVYRCAPHRYRPADVESWMKGSGSVWMETVEVGVAAKMVGLPPSEILRALNSGALRGYAPTESSARRVRRDAVMEWARTRYSEEPNGPTPAAMSLLVEGKSQYEAAEIYDITPSAVRRQASAYLRNLGIANDGLVSALVTHPLALVRHTVTRALRRGEPRGRADDSFEAHLVDTYTDDIRQWGKRSVPDDLTLVQSILVTLAAGPAMTNSVRHALGPDPKRMSEMVGTGSRWGGLARPTCIEYANARKTAVRLITCPHSGCDGIADRAVLLPETASSGYGVICRTCRRMPNTEDPRWANLIFPPEYTKLWSANKDGSTTTVQQVPDPGPLDGISTLDFTDALVVAGQVAGLPEGITTLVAVADHFGVHLPSLRLLVSSPSSRFTVERVRCPGVTVTIPIAEVAHLDPAWISAYQRSRISLAEIYRRYALTPEDLDNGRYLREAEERGELDAGPASLPGSGSKRLRRYLPEQIASWLEGPGFTWARCWGMTRASAHSGVAVEHLLAAIRSGELVGHPMPGGRVRVHPNDLTEWVKSARTADET